MRVADKRELGEVTYDTLRLHRQETSTLPQRAGDKGRADVTIIVGHLSSRAGRGSLVA